MPRHQRASCAVVTALGRPWRRKKKTLKVIGYPTVIAYRNHLLPRSPHTLAQRRRYFSPVQIRQPSTDTSPPSCEDSRFASLLRRYFAPFPASCEDSRFASLLRRYFAPHSLLTRTADASRPSLALAQILHALPCVPRRHDCPSPTSSPGRYLALFPSFDDTIVPAHFNRGYLALFLSRHDCPSPTSSPGRYLATTVPAPLQSQILGALPLFDDTIVSGCLL